MTQAQLIRVLGLVAMAGVALAAFVVPGYREASALSEEIGEYRAELGKPNSGPEVIGRLSQELETLRSLSDRRMTPIPESSDVAGLIRELSSMLDELGLHRREITTGESRTLEEASSMPMTVTLHGPFPAVAEAVRRIESLGRLVRVQRLRVSSEQPRRGEIDRSGAVRADLLIEVFYAPRDVLDAGAPGGGR